MPPTWYSAVGTGADTMTLLEPLSIPNDRDTTLCVNGRRAQLVSRLWLVQRSVDLLDSRVRYLFGHMRNDHSLALVLREAESHQRVRLPPQAPLLACSGRAHD